MSDLPEPLTPPECDLRDFSRLMIDITRLFSSTFNAKASRNPLAWMIGHKLWYRSWHQVPAASLPDDDEELCYLAELGFDLRSFRKAKDLAMHGWVKCSDGRLYHPVVAEAAMDAWESKLRRRYNSECGRIKKHNQRHKTDFTPPSYEEFVANGCEPVPLSVLKDCSGTSPDRPPGPDDVSPGTRADVPREITSKGKGKGEGKGKGDSNNSPSDSSISDADDGEEGTPMLPAVLDQPDSVELAFERWQALRSRIHPGSRTLVLTAQRRSKLAKRLAEIGGLDGWARCLASVETSPLLRGAKTDWRAEIDWLLEPKNLTKVLDGNYDHDEKHERSPANPGRRTDVPCGPVDALGIAIAQSGLGG